MVEYNGATTRDYSADKPIVNRAELSAFINLHFPVYTAKEYGIKGDGVVDDTAALQALINLVRDQVRSTGMLANNIICLAGGQYRISSRLIVPTYVKLVSMGTVIFNWHGAGDSTIHVTALSDDPVLAGLNKQQWQNSDILAGHLGGFIINSKVAKGAANGGLEVGPRSDIGQSTCRYSMTNVAIAGFDTGMKVNVFNHFIASYNNFHVESNTVALAVGGSGALTNSGENFRFNNCLFAGATTGIDIGSPAIDMNFYGCSFDFIEKMIAAPYGYQKLAFYGGHVEAINDALTAGGGVINSTVSSGVIQLYFEGTTFYCKSQTLFKGTNVVVTGTIQDRSQNGNVNTVYPGSIRCEDQINANDFKSISVIERRVLSRNQNRIADPYWAKETPGAVASLIDWTYAQSGTAVSIDASTPNASGNSLKLVIAAGGYIELTYKYDIPIRDVNALRQTVAFKTSAIGTNISFRAILKDVSGGSTTTAFVTCFGATGLAAGPWNSPAYLTDIASADRTKANNASTIRPAVLISNPTGASMDVYIPFIYLGS